MTETTTVETGLTPDLIDHLKRLSPSDKLRVLDHLTADTTDELRRAWRVEIGRRIDAVRKGEMKTYTLDETMAYLQTIVDEGAVP